MIQAQWGIHEPGCVECCEPDDSCHPYTPCCFRNIRLLWAALVEDDDTPTRNLDTAIVSRLTIKNKENSLVSPDWSVFNVIDSVATGGSDQVTFSHHNNSGCDFGIDITMEHWFCSDESDLWHVELTVCNPHDYTIHVQPDHGKVSFCISFENDFVTSPACCAVLETTEQGSPTAILAGEEHIFKFWFSKADYTNAGCFTECFTPGPPIYIEPNESQQFLEDEHDSTCLRPIMCLPGAQATVPALPTALDCEDTPCPPCSCYKDLDGGCRCTCGGDENMGSCAPPKKIISGCSHSSGAIRICSEGANGFAPSNRVLEIWNDECEQIVEILFNDATDTWSFILNSDGPVGSGGAAAVVKSLASLPNCSYYTVRWSHTGAGGTALIEVDGEESTGGTVHADWEEILPTGTCYALASVGTTVAIKAL